MQVGSRGRFLAQAIFFYDDAMVEQGAATQVSVKRERRRAGISAANVGASIL